MSGILIIQNRLLVAYTIFVYILKSPLRATSCNLRQPPTHRQRCTLIESGLSRSIIITGPYTWRWRGVRVNLSEDSR